MGTDNLVLNDIYGSWVTIDTSSKPVKAISFGEMSTGKSFAVGALDTDATWTMAWDTLEEDEFAWK